MKKIFKFIPNSITISRIIMSVLFVSNILEQFVYGKGKLLNLTVIFLAICISDLFDGKIARKTGSTYTIGAKLDVFADLFYILVSYSALIILRILPLWFLVFICIKFIEFLITSNFIRKHNNSSMNPFVFDKIGRIAAAMFFIMPGIACFIKNMMPYNAMKLIHISLYTIFTAGVYSTYLRIKNCFMLLSLNNSLYEH